MTGCVCKQPGWCERHAVMKHEAFWKLCQTKADYFEAWERGVGPGQDEPHDVRIERSPRRLPVPVPYQSDGRLEFVTVAQLAQDAVRLATLLPVETDTVVAIPRSGLIPASIIACLLHLPLRTIVDGLVVPCGHGGRLNDCGSVGRRIAFVDDTYAGGCAQRNLQDAGLLVEPHLHAVVYSSVMEGPHLYAKHLPFPHLLEWNLFNSCYLHSISTDMDGVLCHNPPHGDVPLYLPRKTPIKAIITARPATERVKTIRWLAMHDIQYERLYMWPHGTAATNPAALAQWKADMVREIRACWYVESEPGLADLIRSHGIRVLCPKQGYME